MTIADINKPLSIGLRIVRGTNIVGLRVSMSVKSTGNPVDWTGYSFDGQVKKNRSQRESALATLTVTTPTPTDGVLVIDSTDVADLSAGEYFYFVRATIGDSNPVVLEGEFYVEAV